MTYKPPECLRQQREYSPISGPPMNSKGYFSGIEEAVLSAGKHRFFRAFRHKLAVAALYFPSMLLGALFLVAGFYLTSFPDHPGEMSNIVAWLESDGYFWAKTFGICCGVVGLGVIIVSLRHCRKNRAIFIRSTLICTIESGVWDSLLQQLWTTWFKRSDLTCRALPTKKRLYIRGEVPEGFDKLEELSIFLSVQLLKNTGYCGSLQLEVTSVEPRKD